MLARALTLLNSPQFKGMYHIKFSSAHYDTKFVDRDKMIKACDALVAWKPNLTIIYTDKKQLTKPHLSVKLYIDQSNMTKTYDKQMHVTNCEYLLLSISCEKPEDQWSCKRSPDILIYCKEMTLTFNTHIPS